MNIDVDRAAARRAGASEARASEARASEARASEAEGPREASGSGSGDLPPLGERPFCTIVIPCYNEELYIEAAVRGAMQQSYPAERTEILVVDGRSTDRTRAIVANLSLEDRRVMLLDNPGRYQSIAMNIAIRASRGDVIVRMDAHAEYAPDYVERSIDVLRRTGAMNVGGAARPRFRNAFQRALAAALSTPLGVGGSAYRDPEREGFVESVWNGAFRRESFEIAGLYDPDAVTNEDAELNQRIIEGGGSVYLSREVVVYYYPRSNLRGLARQYFSYGAGRARTLYKRRGLLSIRPLIPFGLVTAVACLGVLSFAEPLAAVVLALLLGAYATVFVGASVKLSMEGGPAIFPRLLAIFPTMHFAHGLGFWFGLVRHLSVAQAPAPVERLSARTAR